MEIDSFIFGCKQSLKILTDILIVYQGEELITPSY